jgi:hypothetical protein
MTAALPSKRELERVARKRRTLQPMSDIEFRIGHDEVILRQRYEVASIVNDLLVAVWFVIGSVLFFSDSTATAGTWLFLLGSIQLMVRPMIRLARKVHVQRLSQQSVEPDDDF